MPVYSYKCECGADFDRCLPVSMYKDPQTCDCGKIATKQVCAPSFFMAQDINYQSPIDGRPITSMQARIDDLKRADCVPWEPGIGQDGERNKRESEARLDREIDTVVDREIAKMPEEKKARLANELAAGADIQLVRN